MMRRNLHIMTIAVGLMMFNCKDGAPGAVGPQGAAGAVGATGAKGPTGDVGASGNKGLSGASGIYSAFQTGWKDIVWVADPAKSNSSSGDAMSFSFKDDKITTQRIQNSLKDMYLSSESKRTYLKLNAFPLYFIDVSPNHSFKAEYELTPGNIKISLVNNKFSNNSAALVDSLNKYKIKFNFSMIY